MATEIVHFFAPEQFEVVLEYRLWYTTVQGCNRDTFGVITNSGVQTAQAMRDEVLRMQTDFVRENWHLMEVTTPMVQRYRGLEGGHGRLKIERKLEESNV